MKREVGSVAGMMAVFAVAIHTLFPADPDAVKASSGKTQEKKSGGRTGSTNANTSGLKGNAPAPIDGPWLATQAFFNPGPTAPDRLTRAGEVLLLSTDPFSAKTEKHLQDLMGVPENPHTVERWTIVATVADPVHTRFPLFFDDQIESIERAAAIQGWEFSGQWLPWGDHAASTDNIEQHRKERQLEEEQETMPGVLVFRRGAEACSEGYCFPTQALFVFLVSETPTKGIAGDAFNVALNLASALTSPGKKIGLLAPTFSGSFESLGRFVDAWRRDRTGSAGIYDTVYGGSISSSSYASAFHAKTGLTFRSGIASSGDYQKAFDALLDRYHIDPEKAAYWIEDESAYGVSFGAAAAKGKKIPVYTFPREISHLRNAYQEATQGSRTSSRYAAPGLDISLKDPSHGEDSIRVFSDTHTPLAQSAAISTITEEFRREGTQIVFIVASNTLDALLLAKFMRNESPDTRVLIGDADILFLPAASQDSLAGTLFLSTYPMFTLGQEWLTRADGGKFNDKGLHLVFPGANFEGLFNVTQLLLAGIKAPLPVRDGDTLFGYRPLEIKGQDAHPGLWLLSLTHYGFDPIDWLPTEPADPARPWLDSNPKGVEPCDSKAGCSLEDEDQFPLDAPSRGWDLAAVGMILLNFASCFLYLKKAKQYRLALRDGCDMRLPALLGAGLSLSLSVWILALPEWRVVLRDWHPFVRWAATVVIGLALLAPLAPVAAICYKSIRDRFARTYVVGMLVLFGSIAVAWYYACGGVQKSSEARDLLFRVRAGELFSGSSPVLPLFVLSLIFAAGFFLYFRRYAEAAVSRGPLGLDTNPALADRYKAINAFIQAPFEMDNASRGWRLGICMALVGLAMLFVWRGMSAFEIAWYNLTLLTAIAMVLLALATATYDLTGIWLNLKGFLTELEKQPSFGKAEFKRVAEEWPHRRLAFWKLLPPAPPDSSSAEKFCVYIVYAVRQTQRIAWSTSLGLLTLIAVLSAYSAQAPQMVGRFIAVLFFVIGGIVIWVFASMERNGILSRIARTEPGELNFEFWMQATAAIVLPLFGVLIHLFPSIGSFMSSWVAPSLEALR